MARENGSVAMPAGQAAPVIVNNMMPGQSSLEKAPPSPGATRAPADTNYNHAIPDRLPPPPVGNRQVMVQRADPAPPPFEKPTQMSGFAIRRGNPVPSDSRGPLPNRIGQAQAGQLAHDAAAGPHFAIPGQVNAGTVFSSAPDRELPAVSASGAGITVEILRLRRTSQALPPYGFRPLQGHEFLVADLAISNNSGQPVTLDEGSIWAADAADPDMGYMQNQELLGTRFPETIAPNETLELTAAIVIFSAEPPAGLVVQSPQGKPVRLPISR
jgi:hypothetical protein